MRPDSGQIIFQGHPWSRKDLNQIGGLIETPPIYENLSAWENLKVRALILGETEERMKEVLKTVDLTDTGKKPSGKFSLGMKQRLGIAIALLGHPKLLILDEPVNGLDPGNSGTSSSDPQFSRSGNYSCSIQPYFKRNSADCGLYWDYGQWKAWI